MESIHISSHVEKCARSFRSLLQALEDGPRFATQLSPEALNDELDRFKIWAGNLAAHRKGKRSLEYRLRDAVHLKQEACNLLEALQESLTDALSIVKGERTPWDELSDSDTDSESDGEVLEDDLQGDTELQQIKSSITNNITCLFRLSMAIRDPAPHTQSRSIITVDKSFYEEFDVQHVREKFPQCEDFLINRFGRAISARRQYLTYREEHHKKLAKSVEKIGFEEPRTEHTTNSTEASLIPKEQSSEAQPEVEDSFEALSQTSYATSVNATLRVPPLPKEAENQGYFECPLCFLIVTIHTTAAWKQHVYRDLHPYCCTFKNCATADRLYDSRHAWFNHEMEAHRTVWQCVDGCEKEFSSEDDFNTHVRTSHSELTANNMISAVKQTAVRSVNTMARANCPVCGKILTVRALQKHLGHHQEQLALFALPSNLDSTDEDQEGSQLSRDIASSGGNDSPDERNDANSEEDDRPDDIEQLLEEQGRWKWICMQFGPRLPDGSCAFCRVRDPTKEHLDTAHRISGCARREVTERTFFRLDHLRQHVKNLHGSALLPVPKIIWRELRTSDEMLNAHVKAEEAKPAYEDALAEATKNLEQAKASEEKFAGLKSKQGEEDPPIKFTDAVGRSFNFPWLLCKTWEGMDGLIRQAFSDDDSTREHVHQGHYDLILPDDVIIPPQEWQAYVQPGCTINMRLWEMPDHSPSTPSHKIPPEPPDAEQVSFIPGSPPPTGPSLRSFTKSRKGCKTCKRRHIRCDETFPQCRNCTKHQLACDYSENPTDITLETLESPSAKLDALAHHYNSKIVPLCTTFLENPPEDKAEKEFEYRKLGEIILSQVLLRADGVYTEGDQEARAKRKQLVTESRNLFDRLAAVLE